MDFIKDYFDKEKAALVTFYLHKRNSKKAKTLIKKL